MAKGALLAVVTNKAFRPDTTRMEFIFEANRINDFRIVIVAFTTLHLHLFFRIRIVHVMTILTRYCATIITGVTKVKKQNISTVGRQKYVWRIFNRYRRGYKIAVNSYSKTNYQEREGNNSHRTKTGHCYVPMFGCHKYFSLRVNVHNEY